jgi:membrane protein required for colicin V production
MDHSSSFTVVDLLVVGTVLLSAGLALARGIVRELLSLGAWIGAAFAAVYFYPLVKPWMHTQIKNPATANLATWIAVFCGALIVLIPLGIYLASLVRGRALTAIDRSLGFVYGLARGVLVVCLVYLVTLWVWPDQEKEPQMLADAKVRPLMVYGAEVMRSYIPNGEIDKATDNLLAHEHTLREEAEDKVIDRPPTIAGTTSNAAITPPDKPAGYDDSSRDSINHLLNQPAVKP